MIRVLIVEDDPMVAQFNSRYLDQVGGFRLVNQARSVDDALALWVDLFISTDVLIQIVHL